MRSKILIIAILAVLIACGILQKHSETDASSTPATIALEVRFQTKLAELNAKADQETGWPSKDDCDGTLWAGLAAAVGAGVQLQLAEHAPGVIHRRPFTPCWTPEAGDQGSASTVSRDMVTGYLWGIWARRDLGAAQRLADYGQANAWIMGEPASDLSRVGMGTNLTGLLCRMVDKLSNGVDSRGCKHIPEAYFPVSADYEEHIQVLAILLQGEANGGLALMDIDGMMLDRLNEAVAANPKDALYQAALGVYSGNYIASTNLLNSDSYEYPSYVRGSENYQLVHWLFAASIVLKHQKG